MSNRGEGEKRTSEEKPKGNWIWYLLIGAMMVALVSALIANNNIKRISYPDLVQLLEKTRYLERRSASSADAESFPGKIIITSDARKDRKEEVSKIRDVRIEDKQIYGKINYRLLDAEDREIRPSQTLEFRTAKDDTDETSRKLRQLLDEANVDYSYTEPPGVLSQYLPLMLPVLLVLGVILYMMRRLGGVGSPMSFGRSRGRLYAQEDIGVTFNDVAGIDEAVEEVREVVDFLKHPDKYQRLGGRIPKGVLLVGPPGTGKTFWPKPSPVKQVCRSSLFRAATSSKCSSVSVPLACAICSNKQPPRLLASSSSMNWMHSARAAPATSRAPMMNANKH